MGKRFRKGGKVSSSTLGGDGGLSEQELKALADKTSFSLENVTDFHEVKDLAQLHTFIPHTESCTLLHTIAIFPHQCQDISCAVFHERLPGWSDVKGEDEGDVCNHGCQEQGDNLLVQFAEI